MTSILKVSEIQDVTNSNTALTIDSAGRVSEANRVIFFAIHNTSATYNNAKVTNWDTKVDTASGWDSGNSRYVAPTAGTYRVFVNLLCATGGSYTGDLRAYKNGVDIHRLAYAGPANGDWVPCVGEYIFTLAQNDYLEIYNASSTGQFYGSNSTSASALIIEKIA